MELVNGIHLDDFVKQNNLTPLSRGAVLTRPSVAGFEVLPHLG
jgi:hypothetical protein